MAVDAVDVDIEIKSDGSGVIELTVHDDRLEERVQLLRIRGATLEGDTLRLAVDDVGEIANISGHVIGLIADMLNPSGSTAGTRKSAIDRDGNRCRVCGRDFDAAANGEFPAERVVDHIYPKHEAGPQHGVHEAYNLVTVCRGCDDVFLQGDAFRFAPARLGSMLSPVDRQLLAWVQKRGLVRSDWLVQKMTDTADRAVNHSGIVDRLRTFTRLGVLRHLPDVGAKQDYEVFTVDMKHEAVVFKDKPAVERHDRLNVPSSRTCQEAASVIKMTERRSPNTPQEISDPEVTASTAGGDTA